MSVRDSYERAAEAYRRAEADRIERREQIKQRFREDPDFAEQWVAGLDAKRKFLRASKTPIVADLRDAGFAVESLFELCNSSKPYAAALPILMHHLKSRAYPDDVLEELARAFGVKEAAAYWDELVWLYRTAEGEGEQEGLAATLSRLAKTVHYDELVDLLLDDSRDGSRILLLRGVRRTGGTRSVQLIRSLCDHYMLGTQATIMMNRRDKRHARLGRS